MKTAACMQASLPVSGAGEVSPEAAALGPWFHNLHLPDGGQTAPNHPLGDFPRNKWDNIRDQLPSDLHGCTALDIGCNAGFYSIELARRGADVTAVDLDPHFLRQARWALEQFGLEQRVTLYRGQVYDLARWRQAFDVVLFLGVFYHLRYPLLALDIVSRLVGGTLVFQTLSMPGDEIERTPADLPLDQRDALARPGWPKMAFIERAYAGDPTNWWAPNAAGSEALLRSAGVDILARPAHEIYVCRPARREFARGLDPGLELAVATGTAPAGLSLFEESLTTGLRPVDAHAATTAPPA